MNKHTPPSTALAAYDADVYQWSVEQAALLRAGKFYALDLENLAEEIESVGRSEKNTIDSRLEVLVMHLLKWQFQPERRTKSWVLTIKEQRRRLLRLLHENPSLKNYPGQELAAVYLSARLAAEKETGLDVDVFPEICPFAIEQILDEAFPA